MNTEVGRNLLWNETKVCSLWRKKVRQPPGRGLQSPGISIEWPVEQRGADDTDLFHTLSPAQASHRAAGLKSLSTCSSAFVHIFVVFSIITLSICLFKYKWPTMWAEKLLLEISSADVSVYDLYGNFSAISKSLHMKQQLEQISKCSLLPVFPTDFCRNYGGTSIHFNIFSK